VAEMSLFDMRKQPMIQVQQPATAELAVHVARSLAT